MSDFDVVREQVERWYVNPMPGAKSEVLAALDRIEAEHERLKAALERIRDERPLPFVKEPTPPGTASTPDAIVQYGHRERWDEFATRLSAIARSTLEEEGAEEVVEKS